MDRMPADFLFDHTRFLRQFSRDEGEVNFFNGSGGKLLGQFPMGFIIFRDDQATARFFIEPMHDAGPLLPSDSGEGGAMMEQRIYERVLPMPGPGMHDQASRLIDHDQVVVFEKDIDGNCLRLVIDLFRWRLSDIDNITSPNNFARAPGPLVKPNETVANQLLQSGARKLGERPRKKNVEAKTRMFLRYNESM